VLLENSNGSHYIRLTVSQVLHVPNGARTRPLKHAGSRGLQSKRPSREANYSGCRKTLQNAQNTQFHNDVLLESVNGRHFLLSGIFRRLKLKGLDTRQ
jgi:hypothetical protein